MVESLSNTQSFILLLQSRSPHSHYVYFLIPNNKKLFVPLLMMKDICYILDNNSKIIINIDTTRSVRIIELVVDPSSSLSST